MSKVHRIFTFSLHTTIVVLAAIFLAACEKSNSGEQVVKPLTSHDEVQMKLETQWAVKQPLKPKVAVVFVHGLFGDTLGTWTNKNGKRFFDFVNLDPLITGKADILAFGFPSNMFSSGSFDIQAAVKALHARLEQHEILGYSKVVFVGHSMGGMIIMRELLMNRAAMPSVPVIVLIATPQEGADVARIADYIAQNPALSQLTPAEMNTLIRQLNDDWHAWPDRPNVRCAYENKLTRGVKVVNWSSSTRLCDESVEVSADHLDIVKPASPDDLAVIAVTNALKKYVFNPALDPKLETPDFFTEGDRLVFVLAQLNSKLPAQIKNVGGSALQYSLVDPSDRSALLLWPDQPQKLSAKSNDNIFVYVTSVAEKLEYQFRLRADYGLDRIVTVRLPSAIARQTQQHELQQSAITALLQKLDEAEKSASWSQASADNEEIPEAVVRAVREQIARDRPDWPEGPQWVIAADVLNNLNWPGLAARALNQAKRVSPELVRQRSVQQLVATAAEMSGEAKIGTTLSTPISRSHRTLQASNNAALESFRTAKAVSNSIPALMVSAVDASRLAEKLQTVPALKFYGLSLQGDVHNASGDVVKARTAYQEASTIRPTLSVSRRLQVARESLTAIPLQASSAAVLQPKILNRKTLSTNPQSESK